MHQQRTRHATIATIVMAATLTGLAAAGCSDADEPSVAAAAQDDSTSTDHDHATSDASATTAEAGHHEAGPAEGDVTVVEFAAANLAAASYQDIEVAEAAGWASTMDSLGCFENPDAGGMGLHLVNDSLMDATLDATQPEALVYELDADGDVVGLVAHEYIVPVEAWTGDAPPELFGMALHQHPTLPLYVLHTWIWKENPNGVFADWNPRVRPCPDGVPRFGEADDEPTDTGVTAAASVRSRSSMPVA